MFRKFFRDESGSTLQVIGTTAGALAVCFLFAAAFLEKAVNTMKNDIAQNRALSTQERLASLPRPNGAGGPARGQGIDYGATASIPGIRNVILDPCNGMPK